MAIVRTMQPSPPIISTHLLTRGIKTTFTTQNASPADSTFPSPSRINGNQSSLPSPQTYATNSTSVSPSIRHPLTRPLSPDLPTRDALYLFSNFSSYMRSPQEGAEGIKSSEDFRDTVRLLDYARALSSQPSSNVHVLHLKYRFQGPTQIFRSPYATGDFQLPLNYRDSTGRLRNPVPQPFSTLHDPVVKIDYNENGVFEPLPAQAIYSHISKACQSPPRIIVISYVCSIVTDNHLASLSTWALTSSPPAYVFSPLETRIREKRPLPLALHHAIPMSMYAWPADHPTPTSPSSLPSPAPRDIRNTMNSPVRERRSSGPAEITLIRTDSQPEKLYPPDPVASLTVVTAETLPPTTDQGTATVPPPVDRIPLWALAPGVGVLQGSTSVSIGVHLSDFSAINLTGKSSEEKKTSKGGRSTINTTDAGIKTSPIDIKPLLRAALPVEAPARPITPSRVLVTNAPNGPSGLNGHNGTGTTKPLTQKQTHLSPPDTNPPAPPHLSLRTQSWPSPVSKVPGWRKGRKEQMEDTLEGLGLTGQEAEMLHIVNTLVGQSINEKATESGENGDERVRHNVEYKEGVEWDDGEGCLCRVL